MTRRVREAERERADTGYECTCREGKREEGERRLATQDSPCAFRSREGTRPISTVVSERVSGGLVNPSAPPGHDPRCRVSCFPGTSTMSLLRLALTSQEPRTFRGLPEYMHHAYICSSLHEEWHLQEAKYCYSSRHYRGCVQRERAVGACITSGPGPCF